MVSKLKNIDKLIKLCEEGFGDCYILVEYKPYLWYTDADEVYWNEDNNYNDLMDGNGNTFVGEYAHMSTEDECYFVACVDDRCGGQCTLIFLQSLRGPV